MQSSNQVFDNLFYSFKLDTILSFLSIFLDEEMDEESMHLLEPDISIDNSGKIYMNDR